MFTHEDFVQSVYGLVLKLPSLSDSDRTALGDIKLAYGAGQAGLRGVTYYSRWNKPTGAVPFVEVCAFGQESVVQLAGTTIHELGHVAAGFAAAHGKDWKCACQRLGLSCVKAAGTAYKWSMFQPALRHAIRALPVPTDGEPVSLSGFVPSGRSGNGVMVKPKPCGAGIGARGGKSRGVGSGSRLHLYECECTPKPVKARVAGTAFHATCNTCCTMFRFIK